VLRVIDAERVVVEGANKVEKHQRPNPMRGLTGGIVEKEASLCISKVALFDADANKPIKVGFRVEEAEKQRPDGSTYTGTKRVRYSKRTGKEV